MKDYGMKMLATLAALFACAAVFAGSATVTWNPPTSNTDNTPIVGPLTYNVYQGTTATTATTKIASAVSALTYTQSGLAAGPSCYAVTAVAAGVESVPSATVCKTIAPSTPNPPLIVTVAQTAYKMRQSIDGYQFVAIGTVPLGVGCDATHTVDGYSPIPRAQVTLGSRFDTYPLVVFAKCG